MSQVMGQIKNEVVACLAVAYDCVNAPSLSMFGPKEEESRVNEAIKNITALTEEERVGYIVDKLRSFVAREEFIGLAEIHPAWLVEVLSKEAPRIIGIVLRYLPSKQVRYIIEHLPKRIKQKLPQLIDSFAVPAPILKVIKNRFERQFISLQTVHDFDEFGFENISSLKSSELETLFRDLGIHELALALKGVDRRSLNILFNRLSVDEARSLHQRIRSLTDAKPNLLRDAKYTVLEMTLTETNPGDLLLDVGLNSFAKAFSDEDLKIYPYIKQKIEPRLGYTLKRYLDEHLGSNYPEVCEERKIVILSRVEALSRAGSIDESLANYFPNKLEEEKICLPPAVNTADSCYKEDAVL